MRKRGPDENPNGLRLIITKMAMTFSRLSLHEDACHLSIEVKAFSTMGAAGSFYLTRNEWDCSTELEHHEFHLCNIDNALVPSRAWRSSRPMKCRKHVFPTDTGDGNWSLVEIPFAGIHREIWVVKPPRKRKFLPLVLAQPEFKPLQNQSTIQRDFPKGIT